MTNNSRLNWLFFVVLAAGFAARLCVAALGHNFDFDSWQINANIPVTANFYALTVRYDTAPPWFFILHALNALAGHNPALFRYFVAGFLSLADAGILFILWRQFGALAGCWFFLNPISIILTGYHCNCDNLAVLFGLIAVLLMKDDFEKPLTRRMLAGLVVLGFSLTIKHIFFAFPFWLAVKQRGLWQKVIVILVPVAMFFLSFAPYWHGAGREAIIQNIFLFRAYNVQYFYHTFVPQVVQYMFTAQTIWLACLVLFAFLYREKKPLETLLLYTCVLVAVSPATLNEYLAIPLAFIATHLNVFTILYTAFGSLHELIDCNGLHLNLTAWKTCIDIAIDMLCLSLVWVTWRQKLIAAARAAIHWLSIEIKNQFRAKR